jgi:hypothetical protein
LAIGCATQKCEFYLVGRAAVAVAGIAKEAVPDSVPIELAVFRLEDAENVLNKRGRDAFDAGDYETSAAWLSLLLELEPKTEDGPFDLATSFCALERCEDIAKLIEEHDVGRFACIACSISASEVPEIEAFEGAD